jgi:hypothetical protein
MMPDVDWVHIRKYRLSKERPADWPEGIFAISLEGLALLGIDEKSGRLFWDGKEVVTRSAVRLGTFERWLASAAALGTFGTFLVDLGKAKGWWG